MRTGILALLLIGRPKVLATVLATLLATPLAAQTIGSDATNTTITPDMQVLVPHFGGRSVNVPLDRPLPTGAIGYLHQWPGVYFEAAFTGTTVVLKFDDAANEYRLKIDDLPHLTLAQPGTVELTVSDLTDGPHRLRLEKVTESIDDTGVFGGFYIPASDQPGTAAPRPLQIEFIGDSDMTGYGIRSDNRECTQEQVRLLSDTQLSYPAFAARHFDADFQINAISGRGLIRNYGGFDPAIALQFVYPQALLNDPVPYADPTWRPQIIVVSLGGNDFATPLQPEEFWSGPQALIDDFISSYSQFITRMHEAQPQATLLIVMPYGPILPEAQTPAFTAALQTALLTTAGQIGLTQIDFLTLTDENPEFTACDYHPSVTDQQNRAAWLIGYLADHPGLWDAS